MRRLTAPLQPLAATVGRRLRALPQRLLGATEGQGLVEYGLILVLIMVVCVGILTITGETISQVWYDKILQALP